MTHYLADISCLVSTTGRHYTTSCRGLATAKLARFATEMVLGLNIFGKLVIRVLVRGDVHVLFNKATK